MSEAIWESEAVAPTASIPTALKTSDPIGHLLHLMSLHGFRHIPIVDPDGCPVGLASFKVMLKFTGGLFSDNISPN
ncbi:MAG: hypothetical protein OXI23_08420, partial [Gemmatimonadota bacterium]|nr:hypothetical protein [Gemmatimonadota bacterium]